MQIRDFYLDLNKRFGKAADPDRWWPVIHSNTTPPAFERAVGAILRQNARWADARADLDRLALTGFLSVPRLASAFRPHLAECIRISGDARPKANALVGLAALIAGGHGTVSAFRADVTRARLLAVRGIGELTADRILLFACNRPAWPVDEAGLLAFARHGLVRYPDTAAARADIAVALRQRVVDALGGDVRALQIFHACLALDGGRESTASARVAIPFARTGAA